MDRRHDRPHRALDRPLVFGEVLFDEFPDGASVLGGAPFNVAWHLQGFGLAPLFISRVGDDALGRRVLEAMADWGMDRTGVQIDPERPTGTVQVSFRNGQPAYEIVPDQAYDFVDAAAAAAAASAGPPSLLYHGTLALRSAVSAKALDALRTASGAPAFVDVNLRAPWWNETLVAATLGEARWAKLNDEEIGRIEREGADLRERAERLRARFDLATLIVTRGASGSLALGPDGTTEAPAAPVGDAVDSVGAGDAFAAVAIVGWTRGWPTETILARAAHFASRTCERRGAIDRDAKRYAEEEDAWRRTDGAAR